MGLAPGPRTKMVLGALLGLFGIWWYIPGGGMNGLLATSSTLTNIESLVALFQGSVGVLAAIIGLFIVWIEHDELKMRHALNAEEANRHAQQVETVPGNADDAVATEDDTGNTDDTETFRCDACDRTFDTKRGLSVHRSQVHDD